MDDREVIQRLKAQRELFDAKLAGLRESATQRLDRIDQAGVQKDSELGRRLDNLGGGLDRLNSELQTKLPREVHDQAQRTYEVRRDDVDRQLGEIKQALERRDGERSGASSTVRWLVAGLSSLVAILTVVSLVIALRHG